MLNSFKHKSLYFQLIFRYNQFYKINSFKIKYCHLKTKHTINLKSPFGAQDRKTGYDKTIIS